MKDNVIDCEDLFVMKQIENREKRQARINQLVMSNGTTVDCDSTADKMFRALMEDHMVCLTVGDESMLIADDDDEG